MNPFAFLRAFFAPRVNVVNSINVVNDRTEFHASNLANLIDPAKLATLGKHRANTRIQKAVTIMECARSDGCDVDVVISNAMKQPGYKNAHLVEMTRSSLIANYKTANWVGVLNEAELGKMRHGNPPTIQHGKHKGQELIVDSIVPIALAPELDNVIANLSFRTPMPDDEKIDSIGTVQCVYAHMFADAGPLTKSRVQEIL